MRHMYLDRFTHTHMHSHLFPGFLCPTWQAGSPRPCASSRALQSITWVQLAVARAIFLSKKQMHEPHYHWQCKLIHRVCDDFPSYEELLYNHNMARSLLYLDRRPSRSPLVYVMVLTPCMFATTVSQLKMRNFLGETFKDFEVL